MRDSFEYKSKYIIDTDERAEKALLKLKEEKEEMERITELCKKMIQEYQEQIEEAENAYNSKVSYYKEQLLSYFNNVKTKKTKTQESYKLPSGTLKRKFAKVDFQKDDETLTHWVKCNADKFVKIKETVDWANFKKELTLTGDNTVVTVDGEVVEGVLIVEKPETFDIDI